MSNKNNFLKGILMGVTDYAQSKANEVKLKSQLALNEFEKKQNFLYKLQEQQQEREQKLNFIKDIQTKLGNQEENNNGMRLEGASIDGLNFKSPNPREERLSKNMAFSNATKLRQEFINRPETKEYININTQVKSMDALLKKAKEGNIENKLSLDQGLITMFNKLTDPNSVVRESEYARTPENMPVVNRFSGALQKLQTGGAGLTDKDREALVWGAKVIADERGKTYNETLEGYIDLANQNSIDTNLVTRGLTPHKEYFNGMNEESKKEQYQVGQTISKDGKTYKYIGNNQWSY